MAFPTALNHVRNYRAQAGSASPYSFPVSLPEFGRPQEHGPDWTVPLAPLMYDEATNEGTKRIFDTIYEDQLKVADEPRSAQFQDRLFLHVGDCLTTLRMWTFKADSSVDSDIYGGAKWLVPMFGLWHLKFNYAKMIIEEHWGGIEDDLGSLYKVWHGAYTSRSCDHKVFQVIDNLITQSFYSRFVAVFLWWLERSGNQEYRDLVIVDSIPATHEAPSEEIRDVSPSSEDHDNMNPTTPYGKKIPARAPVEEWLRQQKPKVLNTIIADVLFELRALQQERVSPDAGATVDEEWTNHYNFMWNVFPYILLADGIRYCDTGLVKLAMQETLLAFAASGRWLYQREICFYNWLINSEAATSTLQEIVIRESMMNRQGYADSYYPMDQANELLNLLITKAKNLRSTSELSVQRVLERYACTAGYLQSLVDTFDNILSIKRTTYHTKKALEDHIWILACELWVKDSTGNSSITYRPGRSTRGTTRMWRIIGQRQLGKIVDKFNKARRTALLGGNLLTEEDAEGQSANVDLVRAYEAGMRQQELVIRSRDDGTLPASRRSPQAPPGQRQREESTKHISEDLEDGLRNPELSLCLAKEDEAPEDTAPSNETERLRAEGIPDTMKEWQETAEYRLTGTDFDEVKECLLHGRTAPEESDAGDLIDEEDERKGVTVYDHDDDPDRNSNEEQSEGESESESDSDSASVPRED